MRILIIVVREERLGKTWSDAEDSENEEEPIKQADQIGPPGTYHIITTDEDKREDDSTSMHADAKFFK